MTLPLKMEVQLQNCMNKNVEILKIILFINLEPSYFVVETPYELFDEIFGASSLQRYSDNN